MTVADEILADSPVHYWPLDGDSDDAADGVDLTTFPDDSFSDTANAPCETTEFVDDCWADTHVALQIDGPDPGPTEPAAWQFPYDLFAGPFSVEWWGAGSGVGDPYAALPDRIPVERGAVWSWGTGPAGWDLLCYQQLVTYPSTGIAPNVLQAPATLIAGTNVLGAVAGDACRCECEHNVATWDGTTLRLYRAGLLTTQGTLAAIPGSGTFRWWVAYDGVDWQAQPAGQVSNLAIYDQALSIDRIRAHWLAATPAITVGDTTYRPCLLGYVPPEISAGWLIGTVPIPPA